MRIIAALKGDLNKYMAREVKKAEGAVVRATRATVIALKLQMRRQVRQAGLGNRLANSWRHKFYKNQKLNAAGEVWTRAAAIMTGFEEGSTITAKNGQYLAIPTPAAKALRGGKRPAKGGRKQTLSPKTFEERFGFKLRVFRTKRGKLLLIADGFRGSGSKGKDGRGTTGFRRIRALKASKRLGARSSLKNQSSVVMFILVKKTKLRRKITFRVRAQIAQGRLPAAIIDEWNKS
ncbi:MAG: hypothetical protein COB49_00495 [Alphaproteobacteria bacterium]|nr:MAG: hypothetical protein COB49_00495 [Alphaproteobacteria bacterium]